jgi:hypothetical protein
MVMKDVERSIWILYEVLFQDWPQRSKEDFENLKQDGQDYPNTGLILTIWKWHSLCIIINALFVSSEVFLSLCGYDGISDELQICKQVLNCQMPKYL